jgi:hypothetical protein
MRYMVKGKKPGKTGEFEEKVFDGNELSIVKKGAKKIANTDTDNGGPAPLHKGMRETVPGR